jgi:hypothetical protein
MLRLSGYVRCCCCCCCCCCRTGYFPLDWLQQQLSTPEATETTCYRNLEQLLAFLNLLGSVLQWMPLKAMTLRHALAMRFCYNAAATQAVEDMLSFPLTLAVDGKGVQQRWAAFLVTTTKSPDASLLVRAVQISNADAITKAVEKPPQPASGAAPAHKGAHRQLQKYSKLSEHICGVMTVSSVGGTGMSSLVIGGDGDDRAWEPSPWAPPKFHNDANYSATTELQAAAVGPAHTLFGGALTDAVLEGTHGTGVHVGVVTARILSAYSLSVDLWVLSW